MLVSGFSTCGPAGDDGTITVSDATMMAMPVSRKNSGACKKRFSIFLLKTGQPPVGHAGKSVVMQITDRGLQLLYLCR